MVSVPASDNEIGGQFGQAALVRLKNAIGRVESSWRPASADEGFEIVRRRLFQPLSGDQFAARDAVAHAFTELYAAQHSEFPAACREADYQRRLKLAYPIHPQLALLLDQTISDSRWDITYLGMQVMIEGVALAAFSLIRDFTEHPLPRSLNAYVMKDEARHVAFGLLALQDAYRDLTEAERREREEFVIEAAWLLRDRILAQELYANLGLDVDECLAFMEQSDIMTIYRQQLFARVVPTVKRIGLWSDKIQQAFIDFGVLAFADAEPTEMFDNDERIAEELEAAIAARRNGERTPAGRAADIAETIAVGEG